MMIVPEWWDTLLTYLERNGFDFEIFLVRKASALDQLYPKLLISPCRS
jgi:hypothetical protein